MFTWIVLNTLSRISTLVAIWPPNLHDGDALAVIAPDSMLLRLLKGAKAFMLLASSTVISNPRISLSVLMVTSY